MSNLYETRAHDDLPNSPSFATILIKKSAKFTDFEAVVCLLIRQIDKTLIGKSGGNLDLWGENSAPKGPFYKFLGKIFVKNVA